MNSNINTPRIATNEMQRANLTKLYDAKTAVNAENELSPQSIDRPKAKIILFCVNGSLKIKSYVRLTLYRSELVQFIEFHCCPVKTFLVVIL